MAHPDMFPAATLNTLASEIGLRVPATLRAAKPALHIAETFSVWMLGLDATTKPDQDISKLAQQTSQWHHQIKSSGKVETFARSVPHGPNPTDWTIAQLTTASPIAEKIDKAADWIDNNVKGDPLVRLLIVPAYYLHAFWLEDQGTSHVLVIDMPDGFTRLKYNTLYASKEFLEALAKERHATPIPAAPGS